MWRTDGFDKSLSRIEVGNLRIDAGLKVDFRRGSRC